MDNVRDALMRMVKAYNNGKKMLEAYHTVGLDDNMIHQICSDIAEAIYKLIGEHTEEWKYSVTCIVLNAPYLNDERRVGMLLAEYLKNSAEKEHEQIQQPAPHCIRREEIRKSVNKNGGYMFPEGDWK